MMKRKNDDDDDASSFLLRAVLVMMIIATVGSLAGSLELVTMYVVLGIDRRNAM
jgi:hypothetical protein